MREFALWSPLPEGGGWGWVRSFRNETASFHSQRAEVFLVPRCPTGEVSSRSACRALTEGVPQLSAPGAPPHSSSRIANGGGVRARALRSDNGGGFGTSRISVAAALRRFSPPPLPMGEVSERRLCGAMTEGAPEIRRLDCNTRYVRWMPHHPRAATSPSPARAKITFVYAVANPILRTFRSVPAPGRDPIVATRTPRSAATFSLAAMSVC